MASPSLATNQVEELEGEIPQLPVIVPGTVQGNIGTTIDLDDETNGEIPAVVSITRVPARAKPVEEMKSPPPGIKVRTDLGPSPRTGPPPLLRVAGPPPRPSLPPMPKLKLGGQRAPQPRFHSPQASNGMGMMMGMGNPGFQGGQMTSMGQMLALSQAQHHQPLGLPVIAGTMSLKQLRPKAPAPTISPRGMVHGNRMVPAPARQPTRPPFTPTSRPLQVRTVFVPPPMKMKGQAAPQPSKPSSGPGPKVINSFPLNIPGLPAPISITPLANGKSNGPTPVIKGVEVNGSSGNRTIDEYDEIELDDDDDGVDENDEEYNEIQESSGNVVLEGVPVTEEPKEMVISGVSSLRNNSADATDSNQRAKKTFRTEKVGESNAEGDSKTKKRPLDSVTQNGIESVKRPRLEGESVKEETSKLAERLTMPPKQAGPRCICNAAPLAEEGGEVCGAVEVVGGHRVGCRNKVVRREMVRSCRQPHALPMAMCELHRRRLASHAACPLCGEFCSHGLVYMCRPSRGEQPHLFHRSCYQAKPKEERACPHCGTRRTPLAVQLKMGMGSSQLKFLHFTAKISMAAKGIKRDDEKIALERWETGKRREKQIKYKLPNGKVISGNLLPDGMEPERLEEVIKGFENKSNAKCTTRNMYVPTSAGDNVKLLQLLALDYSPMQKFPEADGGTPLHVAAGGNHILTAHILLQAGAEVDAFDDNNETPLMIAAYNGYPAMTRYLITTGAKLELKSDDGMTALHLATQNGHLECAHIILGSNNLPRNHINVKDDGGWTPLVWACEHKHEPVIRFLLEQGCDPYSTDVEMNVALHWAAFSGSKNSVELLLAAGSNVNETNGIGETPLHIALRQDHYECALLLIARGARLDIPNQQGQLPAQCISDETPNKAASLLQLGTTLQKLMSERKQKFLTEKTVCQDISNAKETIPVTAVNGEDLDQGPSGYVYVRNNVVTSPLPIDRNISKLEHCECKDNCTSEETCKCSDISVRSWYDQSGVIKEGFDFMDPPMIFECNDMCSCNVTSCNNRVVQHGITYRMQLYKTYGMGWGVKSLVDIPKGGFVCEYVGELISDAEAEQRENDSYLFDLENRDGDTFCIDANKFGNVTRFINHSCAPNLVPVKVFTSHQDLRFPHIAMFASKDIKKGDVLGFDYGEKFWVIKHKEFTCWCGLEKCKYSKTAIGKTLEAYYKKIELNKSPVEEEQKQTGKLKLKLKMEEGKVVKVDDSGLLPDEPGRKTPGIDRTNRKSTDSKDEERKAKKLVKEATKDASKSSRESSQDVTTTTPSRSILPVKRINLINDFPGDEKKHKCKFCPELFKTAVGLNNHIRTHKEANSIGSDPGDNQEEMEIDEEEDLKNQKSSKENSLKEGRNGKGKDKEKAITKVEVHPKINKLPTKTEVKQMVTSILESRAKEAENGENGLSKSDSGIKETVETKEAVSESKPILNDRTPEKEEKMSNDITESEEKITTEKVEEALPPTESDLDETGDIIDNIKAAILDGVVAELDMKDLKKKEIETTWANNEGTIAKFFCCKCQKGFAKDDEMVFHQAECKKTPVKETVVEEMDKIECKVCKMQFNREAKLIFHQTKCKAPEEKKTESTTGSKSMPDLIAIDKKNPTTPKVTEDGVDNHQDTKSIDRDSTTSSPLPSDGLPRKARGRPKKGGITRTSLPTPEPPVGEVLPALPVRSASARTSASSRTSVSDSKTSVSDSPGSRPKRSRKAADKPDL